MDDLNTQLPQGGVPLSPPGTQPGPVPGTPTPGPTVGDPGAMVGQEQMQKLQDLLEQVKGKLGELESTKFAGDNTAETVRRDAVRALFTLLEGAGVDLTDPQSVNSFIMSLRERNPELAQQFEMAIDQLLTEPGQSQDLGELGDSLPNEMTDEAIPEDIRGSIPQGPPSDQLI